jgi:hypothetical protein
MKHRKLISKGLFIGILTFSIFSFFWLQHLNAGSLETQNNFVQMNFENTNVKELLPDLFILDNFVDKLKDIITVDF